MDQLIYKVILSVAMIFMTLSTAFIVGAVTLYNLHPSAYLCVVPYAFIWLILIMESKA